MFGDKEALKQGIANAEVASLQKRLVNLGYDVGVVDGKYGPGTAAAVESFQDDHNLKIDGVVGSNTGAAIDHYYKMKLEKLAAEREAAQQEATAELKPAKGKAISSGARLSMSAKPMSVGTQPASDAAASKPATKPTSGPKMMKTGLTTSMKPKK